MLETSKEMVTLAGVRGKPGINIFILHPHGRTSPLQALQMTTVLNKFEIVTRPESGAI